MATPEFPRLDPRLAAAASLVRPGDVVADIGCDHGLLAVHLACTGRNPRVLACDLRPGPLAVAQANCQKYGCEQRMECRLGDGLAPVAPGEANSIVLAGISARTIIEILQAAPWVRHPAVRLVMVPATKTAQLRGWLWQQGFCLGQELLVQAAGRWYTALCAEYTGKPHQPSGIDCLLGLTTGQPGADEYRAQVAYKLAKYRRGLAEQSAHAAQVDELLAHLKK